MPLDELRFLKRSVSGSRPKASAKTLSCCSLGSSGTFSTIGQIRSPSGARRKTIVLDGVRYWLVRGPK